MRGLVARAIDEVAREVRGNARVAAEWAYEALLACGRTSWRVGDRVRVYHTQGGGAAVVPSADEAAADDRRDYDVDHYARVLRDNFATRLARALAPDDFAADQLSLFGPSLATMRPVLDARPAYY